MNEKWNSELLTLELTREAQKTIGAGTGTVSPPSTKPDKVKTTSGGTTTGSDPYESCGNEPVQYIPPGNHLNPEWIIWNDCFSTFGLQ
ncbi:hypothetical protein [uncultured Aquimarina sp.]|uniref:hypothetical protein n=1 Tax=uncultured Aquimarina sp. TaxID=575652 RepID=UPI0026124421|nr:hypothetical protein [uncultured Aquimarina sp.]